MKHKLLLWAGIAFAVFFVVRNPHGAAAATAAGIGDHAATIASAVGDFFTTLLGGGHR